MTTAAWSTLAPALSALFARLATVPGSVPSASGTSGPSVVQSRDVPRQFAAPSNPTTLHWYIAQIVPIGRDELRSAYDAETQPDGDTYDGAGAPLGSIIATLHGQRVYTIEVRIECPNQSTPASEHFRALVDRIRLPSAADELEAIGLAYTTWDELADDEYDGEDGRPVSVYIGRLVFNGASFAQDAPITTIESALIATTVTPSYPPAIPEEEDP